MTDANAMAGMQWREFLMLRSELQGLKDELKYFTAGDDDVAGRDAKRYFHSCGWEDEVLAYVMRPGGYIARFLCERVRGSNSAQT